MNIVLLGPPGSGKSTGGNEICKLCNLFHFYTGELLRERMKQTDDFAKHIKEIISSGGLLSDDVINNFVEEFIISNINKTENNGILFDGYPRTVQQAIFLEKVLSANKQKLDKVLYFYSDDETIVKRIVSRRIDKNTGNIYNLISNLPPPDVKLEDLYQREDDKEDVILNRLKVYKEQSAALINFYEECNLVSKIDSSKDLQDMFNDINEILK